VYFDQANNHWVAAVSLGHKGGKRVRRKVFGRTKTEVKVTDELLDRRRVIRGNGPLLLITRPRASASLGRCRPSRLREPSLPELALLPAT